MTVTFDGSPYRLEHSTGERAELLTAWPASPPRGAPRLVVLGDSFTAPDRTGPTGWPVQVAAATGCELVNLAHGGAGYVRVGAWTFPEEATAMLPADATVVTVWGGWNDRLIDLPAAELEHAARVTFAAVLRIAEGCELVVLGPQWPATSPDAGILAYRDAVATAAAAFAVPFVDTLRWFAGRPELIGPDGLHPDQGPAQDHLAALVTPLVAGALARVGAGGAILTDDVHR